MKLWIIEATLADGTKAGITLPARHGENTFGIMRRLYDDATTWERFVAAMPCGPDDIVGLSFRVSK